MFSPPDLQWLADDCALVKLGSNRRDLSTLFNFQRFLRVRRSLIFRVIENIAAAALQWRPEPV
jgi:hypothetical protein